MDEINHQDSTKGRKIANRASDIPAKSPWMKNYVECFTFKVSSVNEKFITALSNKLIHWILKNKKAITISEFLVQEEIIESTFYDWVKKWPELKMALEYAKTIIAERREKLAIEKDNKYLSNTMHLYSRAHEEYKLLEHERKKELKAAGSTKINFSADEINEMIATFLGPVTPKQKEEYERKMRARDENNTEDGAIMPQFRNSKMRFASDDPS